MHHPPWSLDIPDHLLTEVIAHAQAEAPLECCGLLAGSINGSLAEVALRLPLVNELASPVAFRSEPRSLFAAHKLLRAQQLEILAVYHSHPTSPPVPSRHDLGQSLSEQVACLIVSLATAEPEVRLWWLTAEGACPADLVIRPATA
jgi:proteasome lid subunit RPN8/RPN11